MPTKKHQKLSSLKKLPPVDGGRAASTRAASLRCSKEGDGGDGTDVSENDEADDGKWDWEDCPKEGVMTGKALFENIGAVHRAWDGMSSTKRTAFDPSGCLLCVDLSVYEDEENPYLYNSFFSGMDRSTFFSKEVECNQPSIQAHQG